MSQHDFEIANQGFPAFRSDLNSGLQALASNSAGATEPSTTYAYQFWYDETTDILKMRNGDDDAWITLAFFDQTNDEWEVRSAVIQAVDSAGVVIKTDDGNSRISVADDGTVSFNDGNITNVGTIDVDSIRGDADTNTSIDFDGSDVMTFNTGGSEAARIDSSGNVGIGTNSPSSFDQVGADDLVVGGGASNHGITIYSGTGSSGGIAFADGTTTTDQYRGRVQYAHTDDSMRLFTSATERTRIDSSGNLLVGKTAADGAINGVVFFNSSPTLMYTAFTHESANSGQEVAIFNRQASDGTLIQFRQANTTEGSISVSGSTVSYNGGHLARWSQLPDDSNEENIVKGTVMTNLDAMCEWKRVEFEYQSLVSEAVEAQDEVLDEEGNVAQQAVEAQDAVYENRTTSESYNGEANVGDVIDWEYEGETVQATVVFEDNEQLNRMAVSSVEGDTNVAGVFVNWDISGGFNDMNIAMTGDMVIRIAQGTTVQRGDLLMSAGDGTAKPQGDDIVRSKTIAKVTSTHVSHTYDDGSYLVPCVLMAC